MNTAARREAFYLALAASATEEIVGINEEILFWRQFQNRHRHDPELRKAAARFIGQAIDQKELWLTLKEKYLSIGARQKESATESEAEEASNFRLDLDF